MSLPTLPAPDELADENDTLDWGDPAEHGHMADYASSHTAGHDIVPWEKYRPRRSSIMAGASLPGLLLPDALRSVGLQVEVVDGWETRSAGSFNPHGAVAHWTAGPRGTTSRPSLNVVINGRPDLRGPLCNVYLDRAGIAVVVAAGRANHAGTGGWSGLVGNSSVWGTEAESAGNNDWTKAQILAYPRVNAAYAKASKFAGKFVCGHHEWAPTRKIDIRDWDMNQMRADVDQILLPPDPSGGPLMALTDAEQHEVLDILRDVQFQLRGPDQAGWDTMDGSKRKLSTLDFIREAHRELLQRLPNRTGDKNALGTDTVAGNAANADGYGYRLQRAVAGLSAKVDTILSRLPQS